MTLSNIDTKLEAYKLVHDPTRLFSLLYSKYGDIQEDYYTLVANQLVFNKSSHLNVFYKESKILKDKEEYLHRYYHNKESIKRIPKLNDYYKNYHTFFCKATLRNFVLGQIIKNYEDKKAEIFYKNNYDDSNIKNDNNDKSEKCDSSSLSSLDNITYNKIIFDKRNKEIIDKDLDSKNITITLTLDSLRLNNNDKSSSYKNLISKRYDSDDKEDSFIQCIKNIVYYQKNKKITQKFKILNCEKVSKNHSKGNASKRNIPKNNNNKNISNISNICKKIKESIKNKNNKHEKCFSDKYNNNKNSKNSKDSKDNNNSKVSYKFNSKNSLYSLYSLSKKNLVNENKKNSNNKNNIKTNINDKDNKNNMFLSPQTSKHYFTNITSRITEFNKNKPIHVKSSKRNKSYRVSNNKKNNAIHQTPIVTNNNINSKNQNCTYYPYNNKFIEYNINNLKNMNTSNKNKNQSNNTHSKNNSNNHIKLNPSQIIKYNQFLMINKTKNNNKNNKNNKTFDLNLVEAPKNMKMLPKTKTLLSDVKRVTKSSNHSPMGIEFNGYGSKFNLFKGGISSPHLNSINKQKSNRHFNNLEMYNKMSMNQTSNFNEYKKFMISNSLENNKQLSSLSPKAISSNITINNNKKRNIGFNKINYNKINNNNLKNQSHQNQNYSSNNINLKIPVRHNKNSVSYSNSNYNINFNNLIFYGPNTPTSFIDDLKYNIISNNNNNSNKNLKNINTNFYMMNFNNLYNSRNKIKFNTNNSSSQNKIITHTNSQTKKVKRSENEKNNTNIKKNGMSGNDKRIPFIVNRQLMGKVKKYLGKKANKIKIDNVSNNFKSKNIVKKRNNKSFNFNDNEKNSENFYDKIEKRKYTLISLKGGYDN